MPTRNVDETSNTARVSASISFRTAAIVAVVTVVANLLTVKRDDGAILRKLDDINTRVSRIEGALGSRVSSFRHSDSTGGSGAVGFDD